MPRVLATGFLNVACLLLSLFLQVVVCWQFLTAGILHGMPTVCGAIAATVGLFCLAIGLHAASQAVAAWCGRLTILSVHVGMLKFERMSGEGPLRARWD